MFEILIFFGVVFLGVISFEVAMAVTIATLPRSRMQHRWTPQESRRVLRVFVLVFSVWPMIIGIVLGHVYLPLLGAVVVDALAGLFLVFCFRSLIRCSRHQRLILAGHCAGCLYDLRANHANERCPECGVDLAGHPTRNLGKRKHVAMDRGG